MKDKQRRAALLPQIRRQGVQHAGVVPEQVFIIPQRVVNKHIQQRCAAQYVDKGIAFSFH